MCSDTHSRSGSGRRCDGTRAPAPGVVGDVLGHALPLRGVVAGVIGHALPLREWSAV